MITRLHGASSTLVANPRRHRRNPTQGELTLVSSPSKRSGTRKPLSAAKKKAAMHKRVRAKIPQGAHAIAFLNTISGERTNKKGKVVKYRSLSASKKLGETKPKFTLYSSGKGKERVMGIVKNPKKRRKHHNPMPVQLARALAKRRAHKHKRRNPMLEIAGVPVIEMAVGSVGAIAAAAAIQGFLDKQSFMANLPAAVKDYKLDKAIAPAAVAAVSAFAYKKMSGTGKDIAKYAFIGSVFVAIQEVVGGKVKELVSGAAAPSASAAAAKPAGSGLHGIYVDPYGGKPAVGGMYMKAANGMNGMYLHANGVAQADMGGLGLYQAKSIYG